MKSVSAGRPRDFCARAIVAAFIILTVAASFILYRTTRYNQSGTQLSSYSLNLETRNLRFPSTEYNFSYSCLFSESGTLCPQKSAKIEVFPGLFSITKLTSEVTPGDYHGIRVQITGNKGESFEMKSAELQGIQVFDGQDFSVFKNVKGMTISRDPDSGMVVFRITADTASFDLDLDFNAPGASASAVRYTAAVLFAVLFLAIILLLSLFGVSARRHQESDARKKENDCAAGGKAGFRTAALRISVIALVFDLLFLVLSVCGQLFISNEFTLSADHPGTGMFLVEVSGAPDFVNTAGSASFYNIRDTEIIRFLQPVIHKIAKP